MAQTVLITLTIAGTDTGPFDFYSNADGYAIPFQSGISRSALLAGYTSTVVPNAATIIRVKSTSDLCTNYVDLTIVTTTTTTSTTTTNTTTTTTTSTTTTSEPMPYRILWDVNDDGGGGRLKVYPLGSPGSPIINQITNSVTSGNVIVSFGTTYVVEGSWISGSGNAIQFRVCDIDNAPLELYLSSVITNSSGPDTYTFTFATLSPATHNINVSLRAGGVTPPACPIP